MSSRVSGDVGVGGLTSLGAGGVDLRLAAGWLVLGLEVLGTGAHDTYFACQTFKGDTTDCSRCNPKRPITHLQLRLVMYATTLIVLSPHISFICSD